MTTTPRKQTDPGGFVLDMQDELTPTEGMPDTETIAVMRICGGMSKPDRMRAVQLLANWAVCTLDRRVLVEAMTREFAAGESI